jgi:glyoxylase-like metal-dependent hydrolase (beta-lactamase superfamily II)
MGSKLNYSIFEAPEKPLVGNRPRPFGPTMAFDPMTSTLIYGEKEAILVDPLTTVSEAEALVAWVKLFNRRLTKIYITHGHLDHFAGISIIKKYFPEVRAIATPETVKLANKQIATQDTYRKRWPGQLPAQIIAPEAYYQNSFSLEGETLQIVKQGYTDAPDSTSLYVPSLKLIVTGDIVYNHCNMYVGDLTPDIYRNWQQALNRIENFQPEVVIAGHKKPGMSDTPNIIEETRQYLKDFVSEKQQSKTDKELFERMGAKYPDWAAHQTWLMFGF